MCIGAGSNEGGSRHHPPGGGRLWRIRRKKLRVALASTTSTRDTTSTTLGSILGVVYLTYTWYELSEPPRREIAGSILTVRVYVCG